MKRNMNIGKIDRIVRIVFGFIFLSQIFIGLKTNLGFIGFIPLVTGLIGICPLYIVFGINTCPFKKEQYINR